MVGLLRRKRVVNSPASTQAEHDALVRHAEDACPLTQVVRHAVFGQVNCFLLVRQLLEPCRPSAVSRLVVAVIVDAIQRQVRAGLRTYVRSEGLELHPAVAHCDATTAVAVVLGISWAQAPGLHVGPRGVDRALVLAVRGVGFFRAIVAQASARFGVTRSDSGFQHYSWRSAVADCVPSALAARLWFCWRHKCQAPISLALNQWLVGSVVAHQPILSGWW